MEARDSFPKPDALKVKICDEARSRKEDNRDANAMMAKSVESKPKTRRSRRPRNRGKPATSTDKQQTICYGCNKPGHMVVDCPERKKKNVANTAEGYVSMHICYTTETCYNIQEYKQWCIDSGCSTHLCRDREKFESIVATNEKVSLANSSSAKAKGKGAVQVRTSTGKSVRFKEALHVPELRTNLLSVSKMTDAGNTVKFYKTHAIIKNEKTGEVVFTADRIGDLYYLNIDTSEQARAAPCQEESKLRK